jgi:uncharacterized protein (TIGR03067 family)
MRLIVACGVVVTGLLLSRLAADEPEKKSDSPSIVGNWKLVSGVMEGKKSEPDKLKGMIKVTKEAFNITAKDAKFVMTYKIDAKKKPWRISMEIIEGPEGVGLKSEGIVALKGNEMKLCYNAKGGDAPTAFESKEDSGVHYFVLQRTKAKEKKKAE